MNSSLDMTNNSDLGTDLENNFKTAMKMSDETHSYEEILAFLSSDKIVEKQLAALELNEIKSGDDALLFASNLVGQDGKVREAVAFKLNELIKTQEYSDFFKQENLYELLLQGIMDINGNVCRYIVDLISSDFNGFKLFLCERLPESIRKILGQIEALEAEEKQYVVSKRNFQLYWALEALFCIIDRIRPIEHKDILFRTGEFEDYTIREKTAKIVSKIEDAEYLKLKKILSEDVNYYVRRYL